MDDTTSVFHLEPNSTLEEHLREPKLASDDQWRRLLAAKDVDTQVLIDAWREPATASCDSVIQCGIVWYMMVYVNISYLFILLGY